MKELSGTKMAECNEICQTLIDDEYESGNIATQLASQKALGSFPGNIILNHIRYIYGTHLSATKLIVDIISTDTVKVYRNNSQLDDDTGIN